MEGCSEGQGGGLVAQASMRWGKGQGGGEQLGGTPPHLPQRGCSTDHRNFKAKAILKRHLFHPCPLLPASELQISQNFQGRK